MSQFLRMITVCLLLVSGASICSGSTYWNPLNNACVNECPWNPPYIYYADPSTNQCVVTCPTTPSLYANDYTQSCVSTCPWINGTAANMTFYDNHYRRCVLNCPSSPPTYAYNAGTQGTCRTYCPSGTFALDTTRSCVWTCPVYYFQNHTLSSVHYQCVAKCPQGTFLNSTNFCVNATQCPSGEFGDPYTQACTGQCPNNSTLETYADTNPNVKLCVYTCPANFYKQQLPNNNTCVTNCIPNYWIDYVTDKCVPTCPNGSFSYSSGECLNSCPDGWYADNDLHICDTTCANGRFSDATSNYCVNKCPPGYFADATGGYVCVKECSDTNEYGDPVQRMCVGKDSCTSPYIFADDFSRQCVTFCPQSQGSYGVSSQNYCNSSCPWELGNYQFKDPSTQTCVTNCPINPSLYAYNVTFTCVSVCPGDYLAVDATRTCQLSCPDNFFRDNTSKRCVSSCPIDPVLTYYHAINTTSSECLEVCPGVLLADPVTRSCINTPCPSLPALFAWNNTCISLCPDSTFSHPTLRQCLSSCNTSGSYLKDSSTRRCVTRCPDNPSLFADWDTFECVSLCPTGTFSDSSIRQCVQVCNQSVNLLAYTPLRKCVLICPNNTFAYNGTCIGICPNATAPYYYIDVTTQRCVEHCPDYYFKDDFTGRCVQEGGCSNQYYADHSLRMCVEFCNSSLLLYRDADSRVCVTQCPYGQFGDYSNSTSKICVITCPLGWFADNSTWTCVEICPSNPSLYADEDSRICVPHCRVELDLFAYDGNRTCLSLCPANTSADIYTRRCLDDCLLVPSTYLYVNDTLRECILQCPIGHFADNSTRNCVTSCPIVPDYYADWLSRTCVSLCPWTSTTNYYADNDTRTCVETCPNSTFRDDLLRICMPVCSGHQFSDNSTGNCVQTCPTDPDYFGQMSDKTCVYICNVSQPAWADNITRVCVQTCPAESYADNSSQRCVAVCPEDMLYYGDPSTHMCVLTCPSYPEYYADNSTQTCVPICPGSTYGAPVTRVCETPLNCSAGYFADNYTKLCVTDCPPTQESYADNDTQICVARCPDGSFADNSTHVCVEVCPQTPSYFGYDRKCLVSCPEDFYADTPSRLCVTSENCTNGTFGDPTSQTCVSMCPFNYFADKRDNFTLCVQACPDGYYADDYTKSCVEKCPAANYTYGNNDTKRCVQVCPKDQFAQNDTRMCISDCPNGSYADANVRVCVAVCSATPNLYGNPVNNTCDQVCPSDPDLYAENASRMCVSDCPFNQSTFADSLTRRCVLTCPVSGFTYADNHTRRCQENCTYNTSLGVLTYADNSTLTCVATCPSIPQYYADVSTGTGLCVPYCPNNTTPRIFSDNSSRICELVCNFTLFYYSSTTTGQCVTVCPGGWFADNQTQSCVSRCPGRIENVSDPNATIDTFGYEMDRTCVDLCLSPFFSQNSSRLCIRNCPQLEYADITLRRCVSNCDGERREYADNSTNECVPTCPTLPDTFADNTTYTCVSPCPITPGQNYSCVNACPEGTWADNITRECVGYCNDTSPIQFADNYTGRCVQKCPRNLFTYADEVTRQCVSECPDFNTTFNNMTMSNNRTFADDSTKTCVGTCPTDPWTYAENSTRTCVFRCPNNTFGQNNTRQCVENCSHWGTFADNSTTYCVDICPQDSFAENNSMRCLEECPAGTYADNSTWRCVSKCPQNPALYGDTEAHVCVINCPNSFYGDDSSRVCVETCPLIPVIYFAYSPTQRCYKDCLYPYFGQPDNSYSTYGTCQTSCNTGQYKNMTTHRCEDCKIECTQCVSELGCQSCITDYYLFNGTCLTGCTSGSGSSCVSACPFNSITLTITFADPVSKSCVEICPITSTGGSFGLNTTLHCIESCPINYYASTSTRRCELCVNGCNNCTGPNFCFSCYAGYTISNNLCVKQCSATLPYYYGSTCLANCIDGTYLMSDEVTCGACSTICSTCSLTASNCTKCVGAYLHNFNCVQQCPSNYYPDGNLTCRVCTANATQCNVQPLTYTLSTFNKNGQLYGILTFNRAVQIDVSRIKDIVDISINGLSSSQFSWTASKINSTSYRIDILTTVSLNELQLTLTFTNPSLVIDSLGGSLTTTETTSNLPTYDYISPEVKSSTEEVAGFSQTLGWIALSIMAILIFKGSYALLFSVEVFQMIYFHYFVFEELPYNISNFLIKLKVLNFQFLPNPFESIVPEDYNSSTAPDHFESAIKDVVFFISCGHYFLIVAFYLCWALLVVILKNRTLNRFHRLRRFMRGVYNRRIRFGAVNECLWFCFISFVFFGWWQLRQLQTPYDWSYANIALSFLCWISCLLLVVWVIYLAISYNEEMEQVPKKYAFVLGADSHIPFEMPLRVIRKMLFCLFLAIGSIEMQLVGMIGANFMVFSYYLFYQPAKSRFTNWVNVLIELCYIGLEITILLYVNQIDLSTDEKLTYGKAMIGLAVSALLLLVIWLVWQFLLFLYDFKFIRDIIEETRLANQIHPEEDNLKVELDRQYEKEQIVQESVSDGGSVPYAENETVEGIEKQFVADVVHYVEEKPKPKKDTLRESHQRLSGSDSNEPRLISSRASSRMLFADLNIEDIE